VKILFLIPNLKNRNISDLNGNPGIGGTEYVTLKLAHELSVSTENDVICEIGTGNKLNLDTKLRFRTSSTDLSNIDIIICPAAYITKKSVNYKDLKKFGRRLILVSHHPHDAIFKLKKRHTVVSLGRYQFTSNTHLNVRNDWHVQIPNIFDDEIVNEQKRDTSAKSIVYLGSLIEAKGFLQLAAIWENIKSKTPVSELHVIGSGDLYGQAELDIEIPATKIMANKIRNLMNTEGVTFHGKVTLEEKIRIIDKSNIAVLNPSGLTEAYPMSVVECLSRGVPVIASEDYGMSEMMKYFPELSIANPYQIPNVINYVLTPSNYSYFRNRAVMVAKNLRDEKELLLEKWKLLLLAIEHNNPGCLSVLQPAACNIRPTTLRSTQYFIKNFVKDFIYR
jgi:glycosyltransferase involved in cell wall biosynthesis